MKFRFIDTGFNKGSLNMAVDEALMALVRNDESLPVIRFYQWRPACLSLGYFQSISDVNLFNCGKSGVDVVRRITGGGAVLHENELTYSFIAPQDFLPQSIRDSFRTVLTPVCSALQQAGLNVSMQNGSSKKRESPICFHESSHYEINANHKKIVGSAQARIRGVALQHGSILLDFDAEKLCLLFKTDDHKTEKDKALATATSIKHELKKEIDLDALKSALKDNFVKALDIELEEQELAGKELDFAREFEERYECA